MRTKTTILTVILTLSFGALFAQTNFTGTYAVDTSKISFGAAPHWVLPVSFKIEQQGPELTLTRSTVDAQGNASSYTDQLKPNDTVSTAIPGNLSRKTVITWNDDKSSFTLTYFTSDANGQPLNKVTEKWSIEDGGKMLLLDRFVEQANGLKYPIKGYYTKTE